MIRLITIILNSVIYLKKLLAKIVWRFFPSAILTNVISSILTDPTEFYSQSAMGELHVKVGEDWIRVDHTLDRKADNVLRINQYTWKQQVLMLENRSYIQTAREYLLQ